VSRDTAARPGTAEIGDMAEEQDQRRADKTRRRLRSGGFEPPAHDIADRELRALCDGCGEPIDAPDKIYTVNIGGVVDVRLHEVCYAAWLDFTP
jgi:hypothetical protein